MSWKAIQRTLAFLLFGVCASSLAFAQCTDADADTFFREEGCGTPRDCNDSSPTVYPGADEACDGIDNDCDGALDNVPDCPGFCDSGAEITAVPIGTEPVRNGDLVWSGTEYGLAWLDRRDGNTELYFRRMDRDGRLLGTDVRVTNDPNFSMDPSLVWTGEFWGLAWVDWVSSTQQIFFARLDADGERVGENIQVTSIGSLKGEPSLVWNGSLFAVVWDDGRLGDHDIYFNRISGAGQVLGADRSVTQSAGDFRLAKSVWTGDGYTVVYNLNRQGSDQVYFRRLAPDGDPIGQERLVGTNESAPELVWNGASYGLTRQVGVGDSRRIEFLELDADGAVSGPGVSLGQGRMASLAWTGREYAVAWADDASVGGIRLSFVAPGGSAVTREVPVSPTVEKPEAPSLAWYGRGFAIAWTERPDTGVRLHVSLFPWCCLDVDGDAHCPPGDCDDHDPDANPLATEVCNGRDDDCDTLIDEDVDGVDPDEDRLASQCDNCPSVSNPGQTDFDQDGLGDVCDDCPEDPENDVDVDGICAPRDNCPHVPNIDQVDTDQDRVGDACDNCPLDPNPSQSTIDIDREGDICDLDDGLIYALFPEPDFVSWQRESGFEFWNVYRGDLRVLIESGLYTQAPGSNPLAVRECGLADPEFRDTVLPRPGRIAFYLVAGVGNGAESELGSDSSGAPRSNVHACP